MTGRSFRADLLLLLAALIWGCGFVAQRLGMDHVGPFLFTGVRFAIGAVVLLPLLRIRKRDRSVESKHGDTSSFWRASGLAGLVLFIAAAYQQTGLVTTTAGKAGFITGLYVVFVPLLERLIGRRLPLTMWAGAGLAAVGLFMLSDLTDLASLRAAPGDLFVLVCAICWACHVILLGHFAARMDPIRLAIGQFATASVLAMIAAVAFEPIVWADLVAAGWAILYSGVLSVGVAFTLQVVAQAKAPPAHVAILLSFEAVFAALAGWLYANEQLSGRELIGCGLMFAGIIVSQTASLRGHVPVTEGGAHALPLDPDDPDEASLRGGVEEGTG
jgi:drug/metabolite transporter (DMT)-like permease